MRRSDLLRLALAAAVAAAAVGLLVGVAGGPKALARRLSAAGEDITLVPDTLYRFADYADGLGSARAAEAAWWMRQMAVALYERLALGPAQSRAAALRLAVEYGEHGYSEQAARLASLADVPVSVFELLLWLYGGGREPADLPRAEAELGRLMPWLARRVSIDLNERLEREEELERLEQAEQEARKIFGAGVTALCLAAGGLVVAGAGAILWAVLVWLFTPSRGPTVRAPMRRPWRVADALEVWAVVVFFGAAAAVIGSVWRKPPGAEPIIDLVGYLVVALPALGLMAHKLRRAGTAPFVLLGFRGRPARGILRGLVAYGMLLAALICAAALAGYLFPIAQIAQLRARQIAATPTAAVCYGLLAVLIAPIVEESIFRGFVYAGLRWSLPPGPAAMASALLFAAAHYTLALPSLVGLIVLAMALAYAYERTRNLWVPIGMHACHNALVFAFLLLHGL